MQLDHQLIDFDTHYYEPDDCFARHIERRHAHDVINRRSNRRPWARSRRSEEPTASPKPTSQVHEADDVVLHELPMQSQVHDLEVGQLVVQPVGVRSGGVARQAVARPDS